MKAMATAASRRYSAAEKSVLPVDDDTYFAVQALAITILLFLIAVTLIVQHPELFNN